ncbi:MAG: hypothetical protein ABEI74_01325 [Candidatus Pacearchaeota archaeon]
MVEKCYLCGTESGEAVLFDAVVDDGIVKICERCSSRENIPLIKSGQSVDIDADKGKSTYERLSKMAGLDPNQHKPKFGSENRQKDEDKEKQSQEIKKSLQEKNELSFPKLNQLQPEHKEDLIRNFHWSILRARRAQGHTYRTLAEAISEDEQAVRLAERGVLPENYRPLVRKIQLALGINLFKSIKKTSSSAGAKKSVDSTTLSDLQEKRRDVVEGDEDPEELEENEEVVERTPLWRRVLNLFKKRKENRYFEGPFEIPEEEVEADLNLAKAQNIEETPQDSSQASSSSEQEVTDSKSKKEKIKSSLKGLKSLSIRRKQKQESSRGTSPSPSEGSQMNYHEKRVEHAQNSEEQDHVEKGSYSSTDNASSNSSEKKDSSGSTEAKDNSDKSESSESKEKKGQTEELSDEEINKLIFGGK